MAINWWLWTHLFPFSAWQNLYKKTATLESTDLNTATGKKTNNSSVILYQVYYAQI